MDLPVLESGKSEIRVSAWSGKGRLLHGCCLLAVSSSGRRDWGSFWSLFYEALILFLKFTILI